MDNHFQSASRIPVGAEEQRDLYAMETLHHRPKYGISCISADEVLTDSVQLRRKPILRRAVIKKNVLLVQKV